MYTIMDKSKVDFKKEYKALYTAGSKATLVEVPELSYLMVDGEGSPEGNATFQEATQALYSTAYAIRFGFKKSEKPSGYIDYVIPPLEGLWWMKDERPFDMQHPKDWRWTIMIMQPAFVRQAHVNEAIKSIRSNADHSPAIEKLKLETLYEGICVQVMHVGSYDTEAADIAKLDRFADENGYAFDGRHHEIYLSDPRRTALEKIKTILRHPLKKV